MIYKVRKKIENLEMCRWSGHNPEEMMLFCGEQEHDVYEMSWGYTFYIRNKYTKESIELKIGDYVIKYPDGRVSVYHPDDFNNTFEIIKEWFLGQEVSRRPAKP